MFSSRAKSWLGLALLAGLAGCAGANVSKNLGLQDLDIQFVDFQLQQDQVSRAQPVITVTPTLRMTNPNDISVKLVKVEVDLRGTPELVQLDRRTFPADIDIPPGDSIDHRINIFATLQSPSTSVQLSPLQAVGRAYFTSDKGAFSQGFIAQQKEER